MLLIGTISRTLNDLVLLFELLSEIRVTSPIWEAYTHCFRALTLALARLSCIYCYLLGYHE